MLLRMPAPPQTSFVVPGKALALTNILVPTDFSRESLKAVHYGIAFARQFNAVFWLVHAIEPAGIAAGLEGIPITIDESQVANNLEQQLAEFASKHIPSDIAVRTLVERGRAFEEIISIARARNIDLIIASTHGHTGFKRVLFGSTAERIVQRAPCPMLIVREHEQEFLGGAARQDEEIIRLKRILVPIDFSDCSRNALRYAVAFAKQFKAEILCLHSIEIPYGTGEAGIVIETEAFRKRLHEEAKKQMTVLLQEEGATVSEECILKLGTPYREIIQAADDRGIDLVIMGTHGRTGVKHFLLGSSTERVVRHAHCPVLVVREREHEFINDPERRQA